MGAGLVVAALMAGRPVFQSSLSDAALRVTQAKETAAEILLLDERLTMSAHMAAATGETRWIERYEASIAPMDEAIARAAALAPRDVAARFDAETRVANDALVEMERRAFALVREGKPEEARRLLDGPRYADQEVVLASGSARFTASLMAAVDGHMADVRIRAHPLVAALTIGGFALLSWLLGRSLNRSAQTFVEAERHIHDLAMRDAVTDLPNRRAFTSELERHVNGFAKDGGHLAVLTLDLDRFKPINDLSGHAAGDEALREIARRLLAATRPGDIVARTGGDEFAVLHPYGAGDDPARLARRLVDAVQEPISLGASDAAQVGVSVGIALCPTDATQAEALRRRSDLALYRAKSEGRGDIRFFEPAMDQQMRERAALEIAFRGVLPAGEIQPFYQPLVDLRTPQVIGVEALARWLHPVRGIIGPDVFIPMAEEIGVINDMTLTILRQACRDAMAWPGNLPIALNVAPGQLQDRWLPEKILGVLTELGFPAARLEIEITENALVADFETARRVITSLKNQGIRIALDDFGSGCSSLSHLSELPIDKIKIDRSFVQAIETSPQSATIVSAIIGLGHSPSMPTTAEGIETTTLVDRLIELGCDQGQGHLYARPLPAGDLAALLRGAATAAA